SVIEYVVSSNLSSKDSHSFISSIPFSSYRLRLSVECARGIRVVAVNIFCRFLLNSYKNMRYIALNTRTMRDFDLSGNYSRDYGFLLVIL
ncbi:hypothetical protein PFISCL1PPCAC_21804, partial [Pristionchus fissidentatus]